MPPTTLQIVLRALARSPMSVYSSARATVKCLNKELKGALTLAKKSDENASVLLLLFAFSGEICWSVPLSRDARWISLDQSRPLSYQLLVKEDGTKVEVVFDDIKESTGLQEKFTRLQVYIENVRRNQEFGDEPTSPNQSVGLTSDKKAKRVWEDKETPLDTCLNVGGEGAEKDKEVDTHQKTTKSSSDLPKRWDSCFKELESSSDVHRSKNTLSSTKSQGKASEQTATTSRPPKFKTHPIQIRGEIRHVRELSDELDYYSSKERGMGGFGLIYKGRFRDGTKVAIKLFKGNSTHAHLPSIQMASKRRFASEAYISSLCGTLKHENIMQFMGIIIKEGLGVGLISQWCENGDSLTYVKKRPEVHRLPIIRGTLNGLSHLHSLRIIHKDIKATNVLIDSKGVPMISDFGLSNMATEEQFEMSYTLQMAGNPRWLAPEVISERRPVFKLTQETDIWAFGMFCLEIFTGEIPFGRELESREVEERVKKRQLPDRPMVEECTDEVWKWLQHCWEDRPRRPSACQLLMRRIGPKPLFSGDRSLRLLRRHIESNLCAR